MSASIEIKLTEPSGDKPAPPGGGGLSPPPAPPGGGGALSSPSSPASAGALKARNDKIVDRLLRRRSQMDRRNKQEREAEERRRKADADRSAKATEGLKAKNSAAADRANRRAAMLRERNRKQREAEEQRAKRKADADAARAKRKADSDAARAKRKAEADAERVKASADAAAAARDQRNAQIAVMAAQGAQGVMTGQRGAAEGAGRAIGGVLGASAGAAMGGPAGAVLGQMVGEKVGGKVGARIDDPLLEATAAMRLAGDGVRFLGEAAQRVAGNDGIGLLRQGAEGAAQGLEALPIVGKAAAEGLRTMSAAVGAAQDAMNAFAARGRELMNYSPAIAHAAVRQDVTRMMGDMREAERLGDSYAKMLEKQTEVNETLRAGLEPLKRMAMEWLPVILDRILDTLIFLLEATDRLTPGVTIMGEMAAEMRKARDDIRKGAAGMDHIENWLYPSSLPAFAPGVDLSPPGGLNVPLVPGT